LSATSDRWGHVLVDKSIVLLGAAASLGAGLATAIGALPVLFVRRVSVTLQDTLLGFAAGVMLAASFFSLLIPALSRAQVSFGNRPVASLVVALAVLLGAGSLAIANRVLPHEHFLLGRAGPRALALRRTWLSIIAITLHNFPEGLAVGIAFGSG
jgi:ZIP family zinc transporter